MTILVDIARRDGIWAAMRAYDAGLKTPILASNLPRSK
jgi:hypothetical protein